LGKIFGNESQSASITSDLLNFSVKSVIEIIGQLCSSKTGFIIKNRKNRD